MVIVHAFLKIKNETVMEDFHTAAKKCVEATRKEEGCVLYTLYMNVTENPCEYIIAEEWETKAALDEHMTLPHFHQFGADIKDLLAKPPAVKVFEAAPL